MQLVFRAAFLYMLGGLTATALIRDDYIGLMEDAVVTAAVMMITFAGVALYIVPVLLVAALVLSPRALRGKVRPLALLTGATLMLQIGFSFFKNLIPEIVPYFADPTLARIDAWLHGGIDPWTFAHAMGFAKNAQMLLPAYLNLWIIPAVSFPIVVLLCDSDATRVKRYIWLFFGSWFILGNVFALAGSSVGPVYYDRLLGGDRFAGLTVALRDSGVTQSLIGTVQEALWQRYLGGGLDLGLGISAFPSMHLAVATITALYLWERSRILGLIGILFTAVILFLSVYTGYHYAIDGYASIGAILLASYLLRRAFRADENAIILREAVA